MQNVYPQNTKFPDNKLESVSTMFAFAPSTQAWCLSPLFCCRPIQRDNNRGAKGITVKPTYKGVVGKPVEFIGELRSLCCPISMC